VTCEQSDPLQLPLCISYYFPSTNHILRSHCFLLDATTNCAIIDAVWWVYNDYISGMFATYLSRGGKHESRSVLICVIWATYLCLPSHMWILQSSTRNNASIRQHLHDSCMAKIQGKKAVLLHRAWFSKQTSRQIPLVSYVLKSYLVIYFCTRASECETSATSSLGLGVGGRLSSWEKNENLLKPKVASKWSMSAHIMCGWHHACGEKQVCLWIFLFPWAANDEYTP